MDLTPRGLLLNWVPQLPKFIKTTFLAALGWSENSKHQDFITQVIVQAARPVLQTPARLLASQQFFNWDFGVWGRMWVSKYTVPVPRIDPRASHSPSNVLTVKEAVKFAVNVLAKHPEEHDCIIGRSEDVEIEWTAYRKHVWRTARPPAISEREIYDHMMEELDDECCPTVLYCHGGAFCLMDPSNHRWSTSLLAEQCHGRVMSVRYRLSPQAIFPSALTDVFVAYLSLISPPPDAFHKPVDARNIIISGDSSGAGLATALQILLTTLVVHKKNQILWHNGSIVSIPGAPSAALSISSPYLDVTRSLPSCKQNARWDFISPPPPLVESTVTTSPLFPADEIWPASPPRTETYCTANMCAHPLVSPLIAPKYILKELPPLYVCVGWEGMTDEAEVFCRRVWEAKTIESALVPANNSPHGSVDSLDSVVIVDTGFHKSQGSTNPSDDRAETQERGAHIEFDGYIGMPHTFSFVPFNKAGWIEVERRAKQIFEAIALAHDRPSALKTTNSARWTHSKTLQTETVEMKELGISKGCSGYMRTEALTEDYVSDKVTAGRTFRMHLEARLQAEWNEKQGNAQK